MLSFLLGLFTSDGFMPHGHCFLWSPEVLWTYVVSDGVIALSYYSIPVTLWYVVSRRRDRKNGGELLRRVPYADIESGDSRRPTGRGGHHLRKLRPDHGVMGVLEYDRPS